MAHRFLKLRIEIFAMRHNGAHFFTHPQYTGMGFAIARILKICFANIREVTGRIEVNFGMCITNIRILIYLQLVLSKYCFIVEIFSKIRNNAIKERFGQK